VRIDAPHRCAQETITPVPPDRNFYWNLKKIEPARQNDSGPRRAFFFMLKLILRRLLPHPGAADRRSVVPELRLAPGDPRAILAAMPPHEQIAASPPGPDRPILVQFGIWVGHMAGDLAILLLPRCRSQLIGQAPEADARARLGHHPVAILVVGTAGVARHWRFGLFDAR